MKLLNDSPWRQTQALTVQTTGQARADSGQSRIAETFNVNLRIRFLSPKPVRQAISDLMEIKNGQKISAQLAAQLKAFAAADFPDYKPFITPGTGDVLFRSEPGGSVVLNMRYKVKEMMFDGKLEY